MEMLAQRRYDMILEQVHLKKTVTVKELAKQLHVTEVTIRRDLETLDQKKMLKRVHGGAKELGSTSILSSANETRMLDRLSENYEQKLRVCQKAATYIHDGDCVFLDGGTSILPMIQCVDHLNITIVTNNILIEHAFEDGKAELIGLGGDIIPEYKMTAGPWAQKMLAQFNFDYAFIGAAGFNVEENRLFTAEDKTLAIKEIAIAHSQNAFLLTDSSKASVRGFCGFSMDNRITRVICDKGLQVSELPDNYVLV